MGDSSPTTSVHGQGLSANQTSERSGTARSETDAARECIAKLPRSDERVLVGKPFPPTDIH